MTEYVLEIELISPLTSAAGEGRVGLVDRDIVFDDFGLPILPGRRLKGLWREAYQDVTDAWKQCQQAYTSTEKIFGASGKGYGEGDAYIHVLNAELKNDPSLKGWLNYLQHDQVRNSDGNKILHSDDVVQYFATVRAQTAIDRLTGSAKENTLRLIRTLNSGYVFRAPVRFSAPPNQSLENALALGAEAIQYMGSSRTRGTGKVRCRFLKIVNGNITPLTPKINQNVLPSIDGACITKPSPNTNVQPTVFSSSINDTPTHILRYRLKMIAPAVIPVADGDPNKIVTRKDIPGSHLWGAAAWHYLNQHGHTPEDDAFRSAFLDGSLRFLTAYPEASDPKEPNEPLKRMIPLPHSIREFKEDGTLVNFLENLDEDQKKVSKRRLSRHYARIWDTDLHTQTVKTELNYHHARAANDRRIGRALSSEEANGGSLFTYEAIQTDQSFQGAVLGSESNLLNLIKLMPKSTTIRIGRSRSAQYGEVEIDWIGDKPQDFKEIVEWNGFDTSHSHSDTNDDDKRLIITTLSPLLAVNDRGHPDACFPVQELANILGLSDNAIPQLVSSFTRTEPISGYNTHLRLPRQQWQAIGAGSVFVFELTPNPAEEKLLELEHNGLGLRKGEGFGRIAVNRQNKLNLTGIMETQLDDPENQGQPKKPAEPVSEVIQEILQSVVLTHCTAEMHQYAWNIANLYPKDKIPANSHLGRLRQLLHKDSLKESLEHMKGKRAEKQLTKHQIDMNQFENKDLPKRLTLFALFMTVATNPNNLTEQLIKHHVENHTENIDSNMDDIGKAMVITLLDNYSTILCIEFLDYLITALLRKI